ncbi:LPS O-antigen chain length determinant protein, WzzB/FepE family [Alteromonadaceae bacterium Bs31]|nr:LPS O-antigen chain length determinant protein, WzzB/FepE family [Alteromonadaceae bacterium Bs31]
MNLEKKLEKIEKQLDEISTSVFPYTDPRFLGRQNAACADEIDLRELWNVIWGGKWIIIGITLFFAVASVVYALSLPNIYKSEALLAPAEENSGGGLSGMAGSLGGLASLAGVNLGGGGADKTTIAIEILKSREFTAQFVQKYDLLIPLMAAKGWDRKLDQLVIDKDIYDEAKKKWVREPKPPRAPEPSLQEAYKEFMELFHVSEDKESGLVSLSVEHYSPGIAKQWVDLLIKEINAEVKHRDVAEARKSIEYLSNQLEKTAVSDMKAVFYELIEEQTKTVMFAEVRDEYVFKTIDGAVIPEQKIKPKKALICVLGAIVGGLVSVMFVLIRYLIKRS